jgi:hypothetical protein
VWLGGPIAFSLLTHGALSTAFTLLLSALGRSILATVATLVRDAIEAILFSLARSDGRAFVQRQAGAALSPIGAPFVRRVRGRAPPRFPLAA